MPRKSKGARLYWRSGKGKRKGVYVIREGSREYSTGTVDSRAAQAALNAYLMRGNQPERNRAEHEVSVAEILAIYGEARAEEVVDPERIGHAISALVDGWGYSTVADVHEESCQNYARFRRNGYEREVEEKIIKRRPVGNGTIRRELGCLRSALHLGVKRRILSSVPPIWLPEAPNPKDRWLTRDEAASLIRAARRRPETRYLARFILVGLYTGSRKSVILGLKFAPHAGGGHVDLRTGQMYRKGREQRSSKKKTPPVRLPSKLLSHLRRWRAAGEKWLVEKEGMGIACIKNDWEDIREAADMPDVTPHTLRHTAITWAMQTGANVWHVSRYFGVSLETLEKVYGHHHPQHMQTAVAAADKMGKI